MIGDLYQVNAPHLCAGLVVRAGAVVGAAPILHWAAGWNLDRFRAYCQGKGWTLALIELEKGEVL